MPVNVILLLGMSPEALRDDRVKMIQFSRNFGHQAAVTAGLDFADGDAVVVMDADLQDRAEELRAAVAKGRGGTMASPFR